MKKIAIAIPSFDTVHTDFAMSLALLVAKSQVGRQLALINQKGANISQNRYLLTEKAIKLGCDKIFFMDSDMIFPPDALVKLDEADKDIIGCNYPRHNAPITCNCRDLNGKDVDPEAKGIGEVGLIATGALLIKLDVLKKIGKPYFHNFYEPKNDSFVGEDFSFCMRARAEGYKIFCDFDLSQMIGHIGSVAYRLKHVEKPKSNLIRL